MFLFFTNSMIGCQVRSHLPTSVNWKHMRHGPHFDLKHPQPNIETTVWQTTVQAAMVYSLSPDVFEWLFIETICREHGTWPRQAEATNLWGQRIYPLTQISIHQAVSEGANNKAAHLLSSPWWGLLVACSGQWGQTTRSLRAPCHSECDSTPQFSCHQLSEASAVSQEPEHLQLDYSTFFALIYD